MGGGHLERLHRYLRVQSVIKRFVDYTKDTLVKTNIVCTIISKISLYKCDTKHETLYRSFIRGIHIDLFNTVMLGPRYRPIRDQ